jgi:hypothetical protein
MQPQPSLLLRIDAKASKAPGPVGDAVRHSLNILAGNEDRDRKVQRVHEKLAALDDPKDREAAWAMVEQLATADYVAPKAKPAGPVTPPIPFPEAKAK